MSVDPLVANQDLFNTGVANIDIANAAVINVNDIYIAGDAYVNSINAFTGTTVTFNDDLIAPSVSSTDIYVDTIHKYTGTDVTIADSIIAQNTYLGMGAISTQSSMKTNDFYAYSGSLVTQHDNQTFDGYINVSNGVRSDTVTSSSTNTNLTLSANGTGVVYVNDDFNVTGNVTVAGTVIFTSLAVDSITSATPNSNLTLSGNGTGVVAISDSLSVDSITSLTPNANLVLSGNGSGLVQVNDSLSVTSGLGVTGNSLLLGNVTAGPLISDTLTARTPNTNLELAGNGTGYVYANDDFQVSGALSVDSISSRTTNSNLTLVGNGTGYIYANDDLHVSGTEYVDAISSRSINTNLTLSANGTGVVYANDDLTVNPANKLSTMWIENSGNGNMVIYNSFAGSHIYFITAGNLYGFGTNNTLTRPITVKANTIATFDELMDFRDATDTSRFTMSYKSGLNIARGGTNYAFFINNGGNVSIGNSNNTYNLDVTGTARISTSLACDQYTGNANNYLYFNSSANKYGFGTTNVSSWPVHIRGNSVSSSDQWLAFRNSADTTDEWHINNSTSANGFNLAASGIADYRLWINRTTGNMGVGNNNNTYRLDVSGTGRYTGALNAQDTTDSSSTSTGSIICSGGVGIAKKLYVGTGIYLPTSGGTASELNFYEEVSSTLTLSGIWASNQTLTYRLTRNGKIVTFTYNEIYTTANTAAIITSTALAARFRPPYTMTLNAIILDNGVVKNAWVNIATTGVFTFGNTSTSTTLVQNFAGSGQSGVFAGSISWTL